MTPRSLTALDVALTILLIASACVWSLTPYPRNNEQLQIVLMSGAVGALIVVFGFWRRWGWSDEGWAAMRLTSLTGVATLFVVNFAVTGGGLLWQLPSHLAMVVVSGAVLYGAVVGGRQVLESWFDRR